MLLEIIIDKKVEFNIGNAGSVINEEVIERKYAKDGWQRKRKFKKRLREHAIVKPRETAPIHENETDLCVNLWHSVIIQALYDISGSGGNLERRILRAEALAWFAAPSGKNRESDFEYVCELADLVPSRIREVVRDVRDKGEEIIEGFNFRTFRRNVSVRQGRKVPKKDKD